MVWSSLKISRRSPTCTIEKQKRKTKSLQLSALVFLAPFKSAKRLWNQVLLWKVTNTYIIYGANFRSTLKLYKNVCNIKIDLSCFNISSNVKCKFFANKMIVFSASVVATSPIRISSLHIESIYADILILECLYYSWTEVLHLATTTIQGI